MALFSSCLPRAAALLMLATLCGGIAAVAGQDPPPGTPTDPPALRIPPETLKGNAPSQLAAPPELAAPPQTDGARDSQGQPGEQEHPRGEAVPENGAGEKIREALEGRGEPRETGDPILDGVLELLRSRGSVLDGSALDRPAEPHRPQPHPSQPRERRPRERQPRELERLPEDGWAPDVAVDTRRFLLAEQLLKTARMLAAEPSGAPQRQRLIEDLRREAARCLAGDAAAPLRYPSAPTRTPAVERAPIERAPIELPPVELPPVERAVPADHTEAF